MIFYMATEQHNNFLNFLTDEYILVVNTYSGVGAEDMLSLVKNELRNTEIEALVIDIGIFEDSSLVNAEELVEVFNAFKLLYPDSKIVVLTEEDTEIKANEIFFSVTYARIQDYLQSILLERSEDTLKEVTDEEQEQEEKQEVKQVTENLELVIQEQLKEDVAAIKEEVVISMDTEKEEPVEIADIETRNKVKVSEGEPLIKMRVQKCNQEQQFRKPVKLSTQEQDIDKQKILKQQWTCDNLMVAVVGAERRTGTTTTAFHIAEWLNRTGAKVSYTEANKHFHLRHIAEKEKFSVYEQHFNYHGIDFFENTEFDQESGKNFILLDLGSIEENPDWIVKIINQIADIVILTAGGKVYEQEALDKAVESISVIGKPGAIVFNFLQEQDFLMQKARLPKELILINSKYEPDMLKPIDVSEIFKCYQEDDNT